MNTEHVSLFINRKITLGTKEWADYNINCIDGCYNNCRYCYAKVMARRFGRHTNSSWERMKIRKDMLTKTFRKHAGRVMFPSTHDIFEFEPFKKTCFVVLEKLLTSENEVLVTTKPRLKVIKEIILKFYEFRDQIQFRFTITSRNNKILKFWEIHAPNFNERIASLKYAYNKGFKTSVSIEPFLDYDPTKLVHKVMDYITESIWIGRMNYISRNGLSNEEKLNYEKIRKNYETFHLQEIHKKLSGYPKVRFKDSIVNQIYPTNTS